MIDEIERLPDISFIGDVTLESIKSKMVEDYQTKYQEETGRSVTLKDGEPITLMLYACAVQIYQMYLNADKAGKMNFLKYAYGDFLDNLGALKGVARQTETAATCTVRFSVSALRPAVIAIPQGTRVTTQGAGIYFSTDEYAEIPAGTAYVDVACTAITPGTIANGIAEELINVLVDPIAYIGSVSNITATSGGLEGESDESFAERIYLAPAQFVVAGPESAYIYFVKEAYPGVADVKVTSPSECEVDIRVIGENGELLSSEILQRIEDYINSREIKPMTDHVTVDSPTVTNYNINFSYYINRSDVNAVATIQSAVDKAVAKYITWQSDKIGRDINPQKLIEYVMEAGIKYMSVTSPAQTVVGATAIAKLGTKTISYGGLMDD